MNHPKIHHDPQAGRFETRVDGWRCVCDYRLRDGVMDIVHTGVPAQVGGRGIAADLLQAALAWAQAQGLRVRPTCSYADAYLRRHPEMQALRAG